MRSTLVTLAAHGKQSQKKVDFASLDAIVTAFRHHQDWFNDQNADIKLPLERKHGNISPGSHQNDLASIPKRSGKYKYNMSDFTTKLRRLRCIQQETTPKSVAELPNTTEANAT